MSLSENIDKPEERLDLIKYILQEKSYIEGRATLKNIERDTEITRMSLNMSAGKYVFEIAVFLSTDSQVIWEINNEGQVTSIFFHHSDPRWQNVPYQTSDSLLQGLDDVLASFTPQTPRP